MDPPLATTSRPPHGRHDTTEYEETAPLTSMSEVSRTISRESGGRMQGTVDHPKRVYWSFWLLGAVILLSWNGEFDRLKSRIPELIWPFSSPSLHITAVYCAPPSRVCASA